MNTIQKVLLTSVIAVAAGAAVFQTYQVSRLRNESQASQKAHAEQLQQLQSEREQATGELASLRENAERAGRNNDELIKLRGEVTRLRQQTGEVAALRAEINQLRGRAALKSAEPAPGTAATSPATNTAASEDAVKQRTQCMANLRQIGAAIEQCALANKITLTSVVTANHILPYLPGNALPICPAGGTYTFSSVTSNPTCSIAVHNVPW